MPLPFSIPNSNRSGNDDGTRYDGSTNPYVGGVNVSRRRTPTDGGEEVETNTSGVQNPIAPNVSHRFDDDTLLNGILRGDENETTHSQLINLHSLDDYSSVKYRIELSLVGDLENTETTPQSLREITNRFFLASSDTTSGSDETYQEKRSENQFFISALNFKTFNSVSRQNLDTPNIAMFNLDIDEIYGFSFDRIVREAAIELGYHPNLSPSRLPFRMDISFSGYKPDGSFVERIPFINPYPEIRAETTRNHNDIVGAPFDVEAREDVTEISGEYNQVDSFTYFVNIFNIEAKLETGSSTKYKLSMVPISDVGMYPEYDQFAHGEITYQENTFGSYISSLEELLNSMYRIPTPANVSNLTPYRIYEFNVPDELSSALFDDEEDDGEDNILTKSFSGQHSVRHDIMEKITQTSIGREALLGPTDGEPTYPRHVFTVRTRLDYSEARFDEDWGDYVNIKVIYYIEKKQDFRFTPPTTGINSDDERERANRIISSGALKKVYHYMYSGQNTVVKNFDIDANLFWFQRFNYSSNDFRSHTSGESINETERTVNSSREVPTIFSNDYTQSVSNLLLGESEGTETNNDLFPRRSRPSPYSIVPALTTQVDNSASNENLEGYALYQQELENSIRTNSVKLDLTVRGDPQWLVNFYSTDAGTSLGTSNIVNESLATDVIYLKLLYPSQREYMNENADYNSIPEFDANYSGFFQLISVEHKFEGGDYEQLLEGFRISITGQ